MQQEPSRKSDRQFRRNQTLSSARRYADGETQSNRTRSHALTQHRRKMSGIFIMVLITIGLLFGLLTQFTAQISISGSDQPLKMPLAADALTEEIEAYFGIRPAERLRFLLNEASLTNFVAETYPEVRSIAVSQVVTMTETRFRVELRQPIASWTIDGVRSYVDTNGVVFEQNYFDTPTVQIVDRSGITPEQGSTVASSRLLGFVGQVVSAAESGGYTVTSVSLPANTTRQLEVRLEGERPYIRFTIDREAGEQVEDMIRSLTFLKEQNRSAQYIDVRVSGRAIYR